MKLPPVPEPVLQALSAGELRTALDAAMAELESNATPRTRDLALFHAIVGEAVRTFGVDDVLDALREMPASAHTLRAEALLWKNFGDDEEARAAAERLLEFDSQDAVAVEILHGDERRRQRRIQREKDARRYEEEDKAARTVWKKALGMTVSFGFGCWLAFYAAFSGKADPQKPPPPLLRSSLQDPPSRGFPVLQGTGGSLPANSPALQEATRKIREMQEEERQRRAATENANAPGNR